MSGRINTRWFGVDVSRFHRIEGGPRLWVVYIRFGRKKLLEVVYK